MEIITLKRKKDVGQNIRLTNKYNSFEKLIDVLKVRILPSKIVVSVNNEIDLINSFQGSDHELISLIGKAQNRILSLIEKELKIVPKNHYRNLWMSTGMAAYGLPLGVAFGLAVGNIAYLGIGLPFGMLIGMAVGSSLDKKAFLKGNQLNFEVK